ncbi:hypothetical protein ACLOJK_009454 [Asimina triloba]
MGDPDQSSPITTMSPSDPFHPLPMSFQTYHDGRQQNPSSSIKIDGLDPFELAVHLQSTDSKRQLEGTHDRFMRKMGFGIFDLSAMCASMLEEDGGIEFSVSSPSFWVAWIGRPHIPLELTAGLGEGDGAPYGCSDSVLKTVNM